MAHELEILSDGTASAFYVKAPAWHDLGNVLESAPSPEEGIKMAGLDWEVEKRPLFTTGPFGQQKIHSHMAVYRKSDNSVLGVVGDRYKCLQNKEAFNWFAPACESGEVELESAGSLRDGARIWVLGRIKDAIGDVVPGDAVKGYVLLAHSHDGSLSVQLGFTKIRVVCANTLGMAIRGQGDSKLLKIRHTESMHDAMAIAREVMDLKRAEFAGTLEQYRRLAAVGCDTETLERYLRIVFAPGKDPEDKETAKTLVKKVTPLFEAGTGSEFARGTMWNAFNAVTEFVTHVRGRSADARVDSQWFGPGAGTLDHALTTALQLAA